jgi:hypothetical protein
MGASPLNLHVIQRDANNQIVHQTHYQPATPATWQPPERDTVIAFSGTGLPSMSPTVCARDGTIGGTTIHAAMVAGGTLRYARSGQYQHAYVTSSFGWSGWEVMSGESVASSPDCSVDSSDTVTVVARKSDGTIVRVYGTTGSWTTENLGTY